MIVDHKSLLRRVLAASVLSLLVLFASLSAVGWKQSTAAGKSHSKASYPQEISRVTFVVGGDVIPHQPVVQAAAAQRQTEPPGNHNGWDALFAGVADVFRQADFGFVNLETPVAPIHTRGSKPFQFDAPIDLLLALKSSGVKIVSFANNHVFDQGFAGFDETLDHLHEQDLLFVGAGATAEASWQPTILDKNGIKVGWLGMTRWLNGGHNPEKDGLPHVAFFPYPSESLGAPGKDEVGVLEAIKYARAQCDLLVISIHWGLEYSETPRPEDVETAHKMLEAGASAVIGHHPHVLEPIETYVTEDQRSTVIFYSLGNFLSNQSSSFVQGLMPDKAGETRDSLIVRFAAVKKDYGPGGTRVELGDMGIMPVWTENNRLLYMRGKAKTLYIGPTLIDREIPRLQARFDELSHSVAELTAEQKQEFVQVANQLQMLKHRRELLLARTGDDFVVAPPNP
jgi:poly-gamma-glutamate synthesis protein (capsule biosynthesis protein)